MRGSARAWRRQEETDPPALTGLDLRRHRHAGRQRNPTIFCRHPILRQSDPGKIDRVSVQRDGIAIILAARLAALRITRWRAEFHRKSFVHFSSAVRPLAPPFDTNHFIAFKLPLRSTLAEGLGEEAMASSRWRAGSVPMLSLIGS
jgi:hypothetical protein